MTLLCYGHHVEVASTFRRGLAVLRYRPPAVIVVDEALPDLDSEQLAQALAASPASAMPTTLMLLLQGVVPWQGSKLADMLLRGDIGVLEDRNMIAQ